MSRLFGGSSTLAGDGCDWIATGERYFQQICQRKKSKIWVPGVPVISCARLRPYRIMIQLKTECIFNRYTANIGVLVCVSYNDFTWVRWGLDHRKHYCMFYVFLLTPKEYLTLNVRGTSSLGLIRSISWLLMPWRRQDISSHGIDYVELGRSLSYSRRNFNYPCLISVEDWHKMLLYVYVLSETFST